MAVKFGTSSIGKILFGSSKIAKVFWGNNLVYSSEPPVTYILHMPGLPDTGYKGGYIKTQGVDGTLRKYEPDFSAQGYDLPLMAGYPIMIYTNSYSSSTYKAKTYIEVDGVKVARGSSSSVATYEYTPTSNINFTCGAAYFQGAMYAGYVSITSTT